MSMLCACARGRCAIVAGAPLINGTAMQIADLRLDNQLYSAVHQVVLERSEGEAAGDAFLSLSVEMSLATPGVHFVRTARFEA